MTTDEAGVLRRALDQLADLLDDLPAGALGNPTPCPEWDLRHLVDHIVATPSRFAAMARGQAVDWSVTPSAGPDPAASFRSQAQDLLGAVADGGGSGGGPVSVDWQCAE